MNMTSGCNFETNMVIIILTFRLINGPSNDWDLYNWANGIKETPKEYEHGVMQLLKDHCKNLQRESRIRQPDL